VERSLALEPDPVEGHATMQRIPMFHDWDWRARRAIDPEGIVLSPKKGSEE
jgi:hypothetical protein